MMDSLLAPPVSKIKVLKFSKELDNNFRPTRKKSVKENSGQMQRARTPFGAVPISTIYGYEYPLRDYSTSTSSSRQHETSHHTNISDCADYMVQTSRAMSESRTIDPYNLRSNAATRSFLPSALEEAHRMSRSPSPVYYKEGTPSRDPYGYRYGSIPPLPSSSNEHDYKTISYAGTSPWNSTGFAYTPRYPQSHRGTASTSVPYSRRYPARRFVPSYVPIRYTRRY